MKIIPSVRSLLFALVVLTMSAASFGQIGLSVTVGPPALPVYEQPACPGDGFLWTPGYWAWGSDGYYWVPGTWVQAPRPGFLWTPPYWGWGGAAFIFHEGYWGPHVGFYGGIAYGFGYFGVGFQGGRWDGGHFFYNRSVTNVNVTNIHNVYNTTVINNTTINRVSYNGGNGGVQARATAEEEAAGRDRHVGPVAAQTQHVEAARSNPQLRASANEGKPPIAATARPGEMNGREAVPAREAGAPYHAEEKGGEQAAHPENAVPRPPSHAKEVQPHEHLPAPNTGDAQRDQKYQQQQDKLYAKQQQDHQKLQQKQDQDHQRMDQQKANDARRQQVEQKHQQQTDKMEQRHTQQSQHMQSRQQPANRGGGRGRP
jgi:YXWGXW repeat-containing protein